MKTYAFTNKNRFDGTGKTFYQKQDREVYNMSIVALLIGLGPLIGWGFFPTVASKFGGKPVHQIISCYCRYVNLRYYISRSHIKWLSYWNQLLFAFIIRVRDGDSDKSLHLKRSN